MDLGVLILTFSETVNVSSFEVSSITLQNQQAENGTSYTLQESSSVQPHNSHIVVLYLSEED